jgi:hypothetical protein
MRNVWLTSLGLLTACATVPLAPTDLDEAGKRFDMPPPGLGAIYVVREGMLVGGITSISVGERKVGELGYNTWLRFDLPPGTYDIRGESGQNGATTLVIMRAGEIHYLSFETTFLHPSLVRSILEMSVVELPAAQGQAAVLSKSRAMTR